MVQVKNFVIPTKEKSFKNIPVYCRNFLTIVRNDNNSSMPLTGGSDTSTDLLCIKKNKACLVY